MADPISVVPPSFVRFTIEAIRAIMRDIDDDAE
jgi:hypothetical protein